MLFRSVHVALVATMIGLAILSGGRVPVRQPAEVVHLAPSRYVRLRAVPSRPPGRCDRSTPARVADAPRPIAVPACRG